MKLRSELYVQELNILLYGISIQMQQISKILIRRKRIAHIHSFFAPWAKKEIWMALAVEADLMMQHAFVISELKDKIMQSEGVDANMKPITYEQICKTQND